jgi:LAO/AO transport system kinase
MVVAEERGAAARWGARDRSDSPFTGGAILGDRVRMGRHARDQGVFIRSMGRAGRAVSRAAYDACLVLDAMGFDRVIVETVGVGQEELDVVTLAHSTIIVAVPGLGDEVQAMKAGLLEAGEILVVNKADREGFEQTLRQLELMLHLRGTNAAGGWEPRLLSSVASRDEGGAAIVEALDAHRAHLMASGEFARHSGRRCEQQFLALARAGVMAELLAAAGEELLMQVRSRRIDPYTAADQLLARLRSQA